MEVEGEGAMAQASGREWGKEAQGVESHRPGSSLPAAQNVTVDEVLGAYKQACQKLNCRQIPKLLRQLQVCRVLGACGVLGGSPWGEAALTPPPSTLRACGVRPKQERVYRALPLPAWPASQGTVNMSLEILFPTVKVIGLFLSI